MMRWNDGRDCTAFGISKNGIPRGIFLDGDEFDQRVLRRPSAHLYGDGSGFSVASAREI